MNPIRRLRLDRWLTQSDLAKKAGLSTRTVHSVEQGRDCQMDTKRKILLALGVPFEKRHEVFGEAKP